MLTRFPDAPAGIAALPVDERGFPVPWFVPWIDGKPEFRAVDPRRIRKAHRENRCWICGRRMTTFKAFVIGPMCAVNRVSAEPPSHLICARFAAKTCPFLSRPMAKRAPVDDLPHGKPPGIMIERNPGVTMVWLTQTYRAEKHGDGMLFHIGTPMKVEWWALGREATRAEVLESFETGLPLLAQIAKEDGPAGVEAFKRAIDRVIPLIPEDAHA